ncbi:MAG: cytochrome c5 family protein, partial [Marinobacter salsuginis]
MKRVLAAVLVVAGLTASAVMASVEDEIRARISPVGEVCLQGEECGEAAAREFGEEGQARR